MPAGVLTALVRVLPQDSDSTAAELTAAEIVELGLSMLARTEG